MPFWVWKLHGTYHCYLGKVEWMRWCRVDNYLPGDIITLGTDQWMIFPWIQKNAAEKLSKIDDDVVIIDTHAFIRTPEGFNPGLPYHVLQIIEPSNFISVNAKTEEIYNRRMKDETRTRDKVSIATIKKELDIQSAMMSACSVLSGSPLQHVMNSEGKLDEAADQIIKAIGL